MRSRVARLAGITCETAFDCRLAQETESSFNCLDRSRLRGDGTVRTCRQRRAGGSLSPVQRLRFTCTRGGCARIEKWEG